MNNSTTKTRQIFSLFHELAHLLFRINGISKFDPSYIRELHPAERRIEQFYNSFAAELLLPSEDFDQQLRGIRINEVSVERLANRYCVSREAVMRRLLDKGLVSHLLYEEKAAEWAAQAEKKGTRRWQLLCDASSVSWRALLETRARQALPGTPIA